MRKQNEKALKAKYLDVIEVFRIYKKNKTLMVFIRSPATVGTINVDWGQKCRLGREEVDLYMSI